MPGNKSSRWPGHWFRTWLKDWEHRILVETWIPVRYQPILYAFPFTGIVYVITYRPTLPTMTGIIGPTTAKAWFALSLICPILLLIAWMLIHFGNGTTTAIGYQARFGADFGQTLAFAVYLLVMATDPALEPRHPYALIMLSSILVFLILITFRDALKLWLLERTTVAVEAIRDADLIEAEVEARDVKAILDARDADDVRDARLAKPSIRERIDELRAGAVSSREREYGWSRHRNHRENRHDA